MYADARTNLYMLMFFMFEKETINNRVSQTYTHIPLKPHTKRQARNTNITNRSTHTINQPQWRGYSH